MAKHPRNFVEDNSTLKITNEERTKGELPDYIDIINKKLQRMCDNLYYCFYNPYIKNRQVSKPKNVILGGLKINEKQHEKKLKNLLSRYNAPKIKKIIDDTILDINNLGLTKEIDIVALVEINIDKDQYMEDDAIADKFETKKFLSDKQFDKLKMLAERAQWLKEYGNITFKYLDELATGNVPPPPEDPPPIW